ncbi:hypothetical protein MCOR27_008109 [Pyricularia oryzae]|uniref:Chitin-binding type-1 domain-containing protein n=5 Tax=Pyricularia TaxID=48558 RepID=Q5EMT2_PYRGI|nr:uncharacterized protein MGG_07623 [Pyricularia oryzae 70-15]AAX07721.1 unknown [Pyricularia grisea]ELQ35265.1 hypothetical protein OOU_Y34scaffold00719g29 [Pyricularia oryzae Y34]KAH8846918.1 hypothetical protein MCOR01_000362 [Pyricularia oryzae]EHA51739.1 hypothetical protein MGG_07623 [Pyricularia oryzae 70-15]KAH9427912.1 hypothetical protein MCOR02_011412 [Pyricularia oryzae]
MKLISTLSKITLAALAGTALASPAALVPTPASEISTPVSTDPKVIPPVPATIVATEDGTCGIFKNGTTCEDTEHGACCSIAGFCGNGPSFCLEGCQPKFGSCGKAAMGDAAPAAQLAVLPI